MKRIILILSLLITINLYQTTKVKGESFAIIPTSPKPSVDYILPYPGILPDHPIYFLKILRDKILLLITRDQIKKSQLYLLFADKNLVMGQLLWEKENFNLSIETLQTAEKNLLLSVSKLSVQEKVHIPQELTDKIERSSRKHEETVLQLQSTTSDEDRRKKLNEILVITAQADQKIKSLKQ